jgi:alkanesulfonate monooxygenase SsuD/methylene tetrahydromethanopterin reductase-like flavin-dependent oxidoreductase (luciferase family)
MSMKISLFYELTTQDPDVPGAVKQRFDEALEQIRYADELGFDTVWAVEHHFLPGYSHLSCPEQFLAAAAMVTKRIRLGHAIMHMPFKINHPFRVAEHVGTLDVLSGGRVEFGAGRATSQEELFGFGVEPTETQPQWEEVLHLLPKMWTQKVFEGWESKYIKLPPRRVTPQPIQKPFPPMWVASNQPYSVEFAGKNGLGCLGFGVSDAHCANYVQMYREAIRHAKPEHGIINNQFGILRVALCTPTDDEAIALQEPNYRLFYAQVTGLFAPWLEGKPPPTYEYIIQSFKEQLAMDRTYSMKELVEAGQAIIGSPQTCTRFINKFMDAGVDEVLLFMQGATTPHDKILDSIRLFAEEVRPQLKRS